MNNDQSIIGCLLGVAVGDAMGLPYEGLSKRKLRKIAPKIDQHRLVFDKGMISDDTEHTCMVAQSLLVSAGDEEEFQRSLAWRLRWWLLLLPAGIGYATLKAIIRLWLGFSTNRSGVFSAGNGAAMRSAILGVCYGHDPNKLGRLVQISTRITHTDPKAEYGAYAVAIAAYLASNQAVITPETYYQSLKDSLNSEAEEFLELVKLACESATKKETGEIFADNLALNRGITGYVYHTVPVVIQVWLRYQQDYQKAIAEIIQLGGDTDTTAAILGGIIGAAVGKTGIPQSWLDNLWEYPRSVNWIESLGNRLAQVCTHGIKQPALPLPIYALCLRNICFLLVVIFHGFYRLKN